jgi:hypothetical protein
MAAKAIYPQMPPAHLKPAKSAKATALARKSRRLIAQIVRLTSEVDAMLPVVPVRRRKPAPTRGPALWQQSLPGAAGQRARARQTALLQRWHKPNF